MKILAISQRVEKIIEYSELRDSLDQRWTGLIDSLNFLPVPLPNLTSPSEFIETVQPSAIILSGGNTLNKVDDTDLNSSIQRDRFEENILDISLQKSIPVIGVCRGMQMINLFFNGSLSENKEHIGVSHKINFIGDYSKLKSRLVNSYHKWCVNESDLSESLIPIAIAEDSTIECFRHKDYMIFGIMWHPEREKPYNKDDINLISKFIEK